MTMLKSSKNVKVSKKQLGTRKVRVFEDARKAVKAEFKGFKP